MIKRCINKYTLLCLVIFSISYLSIGFAGNDLDEDKRELNVVNEKISGVTNLLNQGKSKEKGLNKQISDLNKQIQNKESEIANINSEISKAQNNIEKVIVQMNEAQENIETKNDTLNSRLRVMYKNGEANTLEVLLGSESIVDFLSNMDMLERIHSQDVKLLKYLKEQYKEIEIKKKELEALKQELNNKKNEANKKQSELNVSRGKVESLRKEIVKDNKALEKQVDELNKYAEQITEKIRKAQTDEDFVGGKMTWPAPGYTRITSQYGYRIHPILKTKKMHTGVDIGVPRGNKIVAALDGVVIHSNWLGGYGKVVMVDHGGGIVTLYAHNDGLIAKVGDKVKKGQVISKSGSTGNSTGPHLHFEVRQNGKHVDPMPWLRQ